MPFRIIFVISFSTLCMVRLMGVLVLGDLIFDRKKLNFERHLLFRKLSEIARILWHLLLNKGMKLLKNSEFPTPSKFSGIS
jgi:hypothetical protein